MKWCYAMCSAGDGRPTSRPGVQSVRRALQLLTWVCQRPADRRGHGISLAELTKLAGVSKPTVYRLMNTLEEFGLVIKLPQTDAYFPGPGLFERAHDGLAQISLVHLATQELDDLLQATNETVHLAVLNTTGPEVVYIDKRESSHTIRMISAVGRRAPMHCTSLGKAMLAFLPEDERHALIRTRPLVPATEHSLTDPDALERELAEIRLRGYSLDLEEHEEDIYCVGAPVFDHTGKPVAAISVTMPKFRTSIDRLHALGATVQRATIALSKKLGAGRHITRPPEGSPPLRSTHRGVNNM